MDEFIKRTVMRLKGALIGDYLGLIVFVVLFETGCLDHVIGIGVDEQTEFYLNMAAVIGTIILLPLGMKLFTLNTTDNLRRQNYDDALSSYSLWFIIRSLLFFFVALFDFVCYYITVTTPGLFLGLIAVALSLMFWPTEAKIKEYLEGINK